MAVFYEDEQGNLTCISPDTMSLQQLAEANAEQPADTEQKPFLCSDTSLTTNQKVNTDG